MNYGENGTKKICVCFCTTRKSEYNRLEYVRVSALKKKKHNKIWIWVFFVYNNVHSSFFIYLVRIGKVIL